MAKAKSGESALELLKKHYFWLAVPLILGIAWFVTMAAKSNIKKKFDTKKAAVEAAKSNADKIASNKLHPNETTIEAIKGETNILKKAVFEAWTLMYNDQKTRNRWPRQLSKEFLGIVENLKFRTPIAPSSTKQYLLEDYSFFIGNHLPELLKKIGRRRCQVQDYKWIKEENSFFPVYIDEETNRYFVIITEPESDRVKEVHYYDIKRDILTKVEDSAERAALLGKPKTPYFREVDSWIVKPKDHITYGINIVALGTGGGGMEGGMGGGMGGMDMGGAMGGRGARGGAMDMETSSTGTGASNIPGDGIDPAMEQLTGTSGEGSTMTGGANPGGAGGMNSAATSSNIPGLPPYIERRRVVGNVDWDSPEIYELPTWSATGYPLSIEIWYAQESLWVYEALIRIIEQTNHEAPDNVTIAPIKKIEKLLIGQQAAAAWSATETPIGDLTGTGASMMGGMGGMGGAAGAAGAGGADGASASGPGGDMAGPTFSGTPEKVALLKILYGRYLDGENKPLAAETAPPFAEFNKMPVCMKLIVDQRRIPDLLVNCANCSMPIDIKHVRICPDNAVPFVMPVEQTGEGAAGGGDMPGGMGMGMGMGMGAGGGMGAAGDEGQNSPRGSMANSDSGGIDIGRSEISQTGGYGVDAIRIEVYGIINIFNEPNIADFGTGEGSTNADAKLTEETLNATPDAADAKAEGEATPPAAPATPEATPPATSSEATPAATPETPPATPETAPAVPATPAAPSAAPATPPAAPATPVTPATPAAPANP